MSTIELRHVISEYLSQIDDISFLKAIKTIIESKVSDQVYKLTPEQKKRVELGREQLKNGKTIPHDELKTEIDQWLGAKENGPQKQDWIWLIFSIFTSGETKSN